ncbi:50S ribosomal protein L4 [Sulfuriferula plumbiphila]|uniref:Large ribosomal subunit protein uL4 n=1 Tax=Sulfuriferula plumbiphila TaxID=171865 RepID=A0A512LBR1_9PROT|nr:50S ribosomal protein L4 [Sulfuriferula plumbiphila]BBP03294.1 50S ribosomal protein L4 [Sulfuriferula plumbiphila]GEP31939.1 50S ribosomal protein L4 [Sulfuriferula plumbiphila]
MELRVINEQGQATSTLAASDELFAREYNEALVHQVVTAYMANARSGNRAQKDREMVKHSTKKPWRQKGTGRARSGMTSSPIWRGGGRTFPNSPEENFSQKVNRKMYRAGLASILSKLASEGRLSVVDSMAMAAPKTKDLANRLKGMGLGRVMIVIDSLDDNLWMSSRNLPNVLVVEARHIDPVSMVHFGNVLMTKNAVKMVEEMLA